jgi:hypothetical protein
LKKFVPHLGLLIALAAYLAIALYQFNLPGFYYDEALDLVPMLQLMHGEAPSLLRDIGIGRYPVMLLDYMGSLGGYITVPFLSVFGSGVVAARAQPIFFACVTVVLAWLWARRWFGNWVAVVAALLLAVNPSFIWFSRQGISVTSVMTVFSIGAVLLLDTATHKPASRTALIFAGALLGLGLWAKFLFLRWLVALCVWQMADWLIARFTKQAPRLSLRQLALVLIGFVIGSAPLIYYNLVGWWRDGTPHTLTLLLGSLISPTQQFGVNNLNLAQNLNKALDDVRVFVDGSYFWYNGIPFSNSFAVPTLLIACVVGLGIALIARRDLLRKFGALLGVLAVLTFMGAFTVSGLWATHQFIMLPVPQIIVACAVVWLVQLLIRTKNKIIIALVVALLLAPQIYGDLWVNKMHHQVLNESGGNGRFSDAVYKLADYLDASHIQEPVALDWGIEKQVRVLTDDRVRPLEIFGFAPQADDAFRARAREALRDPKRVYLVLWDRFAVYNRRAEFTKLANEQGKQVREVFIAHDRGGVPVYVALIAE